MAETFKARMKRLRIRAGLKSQLEAAAAIGCERGTVGMWEAPSSPVDSVSGEYLMQVAAAYQVRPEYINTGAGDDGYPWVPESALQSQSQLSQLSPDMIAETHRALRLHDARRGRVFDIEAQPERFLQACSLWQQMPSARTPENLIEFGMKLAEMAPQGAPGHERNEDVPASGTAGGAKRRRR